MIKNSKKLNKVHQAQLENLNIKVSNRGGLIYCQSRERGKEQGMREARAERGSGVGWRGK